MILVCMDLSTG